MADRRAQPGGESAEAATGAAVPAGLGADARRHGPVPAGPGDRQALVEDGAGGGLGRRLDRLLRAAEEEASQIHAEAERAAAALLTQAHAEIDRHEREQRRSWTDREAALADAERRAAATVAAAEERAGVLLADATARAQRVAEDARRRAAEIVDAAERSATATARAVRAELAQQLQLRDAARSELRRLVRTLDGLRDALAYELDAAETRDGDDRAGRRPEASRLSDALGRRRGDRLRTRNSGLPDG